MRAAPAPKQIDEFFRLLWDREREVEVWRPRNRIADLAMWIEPRVTPTAYTDAITSHPVYKWLALSESFAQAKQAFSSRKSADWRDRESGELRFLQAITASTAHAVATHGTGWKPVTVSAEQRRRALVNARELLAYVKSDFRARNSWELERAVEAFCANLQLQLNSKVRDYSGADARERFLCTRLGRWLASIPGLKNEHAVEIINCFAELCSLSIGERSAQRYMLNARRNLGLPKLRSPRDNKKKARTRN